MTIRNLHEITPADQKIYIGWNGTIQELDRGNALDLHALGSFQIARILALEENKLEADLLALPGKE